MSDTPDWMGPACDRLRECGLDEAAAMLEAAPAMRVRRDAAIAILEDVIRQQIASGGYELVLSLDSYRRWTCLIAEARGETPEATLARLRPGPVAELINETRDHPYPGRPSALPPGTYTLEAGGSRQTVTFPMPPRHS